MTTTPSTVSVFSQHLGMSETQVNEILSQSLAECLNSPELQQLLESLDIRKLQETLPTAGTVLQKRLPPFYHWLKNELGVARVPDSPDHTTTWVIGFLNHTETLNHLVKLHRPVPPSAVEASVPRLVATFDGVEDEAIRQEWQKAIAALCVPLVIDARQRETVAQAL
ncbi:hypothetical protein G3T18_06900 [Oscillatoria salina IIICB1]|nr:hypothetical protein [Oscillatoria salina IIICB1]